MSRILNQIKNQRNQVIVKGTFHNCYEVSMKSALNTGKNYYAEFQFSDTFKDTDGDEVKQQVLEKDLKGFKGDLEHVNLKTQDELEEYGMLYLDKGNLFEVTQSYFKDNQLFGKVKFNTEHKQFDNIWNKHIKQGKFGISLEYQKRNEVLKKVVGISGTISPNNDRSKLIAAYIGA